MKKKKSKAGKRIVAPARDLKNPEDPDDFLKFMAEIAVEIVIRETMEKRRKLREDLKGEDHQEQQ